MLKNNTDKNQSIIEKLYLKRSSGNGSIIIPLSRYLESKKQRIAMSIHPSGQISEYHTHDYFEINYVCYGSCINLFEDNKVIMNTGDFSIMHPGAFHTLYADRDCKVINVLVNKDLLCGLLRSAIPCDGALYRFLSNSGSDDFYKYVICPYNGESLAAEAMQRLIDSASDMSPWKHVGQEAAFLDLIHCIATTCPDAYLSQSQGMSSDKMIDILVYVSENYATVTLEKLSEEFFYSKTHICRLFLQNTGKSFNQTLIDLRVSHARLLLKNTELTVEEISHTVGYDSVEYFQRLYKKKTGMTPGEYRKQALLTL